MAETLKIPESLGEATVVKEEARVILIVGTDSELIANFEKELTETNFKWEVEVVTTHEEALKRIGRGDALDALVVDMATADLAVSEVFDKAVIHHPGALRIGLALPSDLVNQPWFDAPIHQFLSPGAPSNALMAVLARAFSAQDFLGHENFKTLITRLQALPVMPQVYFDIVAELESEDPSLERVGEIVSRDMGLSAKLLQMANSAYFGLRNPASTPTEAVSFLGTEMTKALVLSLKLFAHFDHLKCPELSLDVLWRKCWTTGIVARAICQIESASAEVTNDAFLAGLLHKAGVLVFAANFPEYFKATVMYTKRRNVMFWEAEYEFYKASHAEIGGYLFSLWGMPDGMVEAVAYHNRPAEAKSRGFSALTALHVANGLVVPMESETSFLKQPIDQNYLRSIGMGDRMSEWRAQCSELILNAK